MEREIIEIRWCDALICCLSSQLLGVFGEKIITLSLGCQGIVVVETKTRKSIGIYIVGENVHKEVFKGNASYGRSHLLRYVPSLIHIQLLWEISWFNYLILRPFQNDPCFRVFTLIKKTRKILIINVLLSLFSSFLWLLTNQNSVNTINIFEVYNLTLLHTLKI